MIQRLDVVTDRRVLVPSDNGVLVRYSDHAAALAAEKEKVRELVAGVWSTWGYLDQCDRDGRYLPNAPIILGDLRALIEKYSKEEPNNE